MGLFGFRFDGCVGIESFGKEDAHCRWRATRYSIIAPLALPPIRNHIDRIALEQQLDISPI